MKFKKRTFVTVIAIGMLLITAISTLSMYLYRANRIFVTGRLPDEAYRSGIPAYFRRESYGPWKRGTLNSLPSADSDMGFDLRSLDLSAFSLTDKKEELKRVVFDAATVWPEELPDGFDPELIMELGKDPGLGVSALHEAGFTGAGVGIAIIDQGLHVDHEEYHERIMGYEVLHSGDTEGTMHGAAVVSIAAGKSCGVAPGADVYYIASTFADAAFNGYCVNLNYMADAIDRVLEINELLPADKGIRVISVSRGFGSLTKGAARVKAAIERAKKKGIFVITTSTEANYGFYLMGLGREQTADPNELSSYGPGMLWEYNFYSRYGAESFDPSKQLLVPMDARTYASFTDTESYEYGAAGGSSWAAPWLAGLYALCAEKSPSITPERFIEAAFSTGTVRTISHEGKDYTLGTIIDPAALVAALGQDET